MKWLLIGMLDSGILGGIHQETMACSIQDCCLMGETQVEIVSQTDTCLVEQDRNGNWLFADIIEPRTSSTDTTE